MEWGDATDTPTALDINYKTTGAASGGLSMSGLGSQNKWHTTILQGMTLNAVLR